MQFNVSALLQEATGATRTFDIDDNVANEGGRRRITGYVRFDRTPRGVLVRADIHGMMDDLCSRCVKPVSYPVDLEIAEEYVPMIDVVNGGAITLLEGEEDAYRIDARHVIDLGDAVAQYWALSLPMAPLCNEDCAGLCPICGEEIASNGHACSGDEIDTRWSALAKLKLG